MRHFVIASATKQSRSLIFTGLLRLLRFARNDIALAMTGSNPEDGGRCAWENLCETLCPLRLCAEKVTRNSGLLRRSSSQ